MDHSWSTDLLEASVVTVMTAYTQRADTTYNTNDQFIRSVTKTSSPVPLPLKIEDFSYLWNLTFGSINQRSGIDTAKRAAALNG
jgi:hypothetical protein